MLIILTVCHIFLLHNITLNIEATARDHIYLSACTVLECLSSLNSQLNCAHP